MAVLFGVLPWIVYAIVSSSTSVSTAILITAAVALAALGARAVRGAQPDEMVLDIATAAYFLAAAAVTVFADPVLVNRYLGAGAELWLGLVVAASLALGRPFTEPIARRQVPAEFAAVPAFRAFNMRITTAWLVSFLMAGVLILIGIAAIGPDGRYASYVLIPLAVGIPVRYTARLAERMQPNASRL